MLNDDHDDLEDLFDDYDTIDELIDDETELKPIICQDKENCYLPIFSSIDEIGEYGNSVLRVQKHILDVIDLARDKEISGLVLNGFTAGIIIEKEVWEFIEKMDSTIE